MELSSLAVGAERIIMALDLAASSGSSTREGVFALGNIHTTRYSSNLAGLLRL